MLREDAPFFQIRIRMIFDYCEIEKYIPCKVKPNFSYLVDTGNVNFGYRKFSFVGLTDLFVYWNEETRFLRITGSFPYAFQKHNFNFTNRDVQEAGKYLQDYLGLTLFDARVNKFEAGLFIEVPFSPDAYMKVHEGIKGMKTIRFERGVYFEDSILKVKLYDAGYNIKTKTTNDVRTALQADFGYSDRLDYLKVENHYKKPEVRLKQRPIQLLDLCCEDFTNRCKLDLLATYQSIIKTPALAMPTDKKNLTSSTIPLIVLKQLEQKFGFNTEFEILAVLKSIPQNILTGEDRKKRRKQLLENLGKISSPISQKTSFDLSELLMKKLEV